MQNRLLALPVAMAFSVAWLAGPVGSANAEMPRVVDTGTSIASSPEPPSLNNDPGVPSDSYAMMLDQLGEAGMRNQEDLNAFKSWLLALSDIHRQGFYESSVDIPSRTMTLLWHGKSALQRQAILEGQRRGIRVVINAVSYTRKQLNAAVAALTTPAATKRLGGFSVTSVSGPTLTDDRITVRGSFNGTKGASARSAVANAASDLSAMASTIGGMSAVVTYGEPASPYVATRGNDTSAFNAGGMMKGANGTGCTSGFGIWLGGVARTTTARHCLSTPYRAYDGTASYGSTVRVDATTAARVLSGAGWYRMFDGAWNDSTGYYKRVSGLADVSMDSYVCSSGANSGVHCYLKVEQMYEWFNDGYGGFWSIRVKQQVAGQIAGARGDSGGPIFIPNSDGVRVWAVGMLQGSQQTQTRSCGSLRIPTYCSAWIEFTSTRVLLRNIGATLRTG